MSLVASFHLVNGDAVAKLQQIGRGEARSRFLSLFARHQPRDDVPGALRRLGRELPSGFAWPGECLLYLLTYLEDQGIYLLQSEYDQQIPPTFTGLDVSMIPLTPEHKRYLPRLDPEQLDEAEVDRYFTDNYGVDVGVPASQDGLRVLRRHLTNLGKSEVLLLLLA